MASLERKTKIVKIINQSYLPYQGRYPRVSGQAQILQKNGIDVTILACDRSGDNATRETLGGISVFRITSVTGEMRGPFKQVLPLCRFWLHSIRWLLSYPFDILHCHNLDVLPVGCAVRLLLRRPVLFEAHEPNYYALWPGRWRLLVRFVELFERLMCRYVDGVSVTNEFQVKKYLKMRTRRVMLVGNYPLTNLRIKELSPEKFHRKDVTFGRFGTIYPDTGFEASVRAFSRILKSSPKTHFLIAGRVVDNYREAFLNLLKPLKGHVQYLGAFSADQMPELYSRIDVSLLIYPRNAWFQNITPRKFFDSLANGVPVIMTDIGDLGHIIQKQRLGMLVDEKDLNSIINAMGLMVTDKGMRNKMSMNALRFAQTHYDWETMATRYVQLQKELIKGA